MMSSPQDEAEDSRTSGVGRKRDLQELMVQDDTGVSSDEDPKQRSHKRTKQDLESLGHLANEDVMVLDVSSSAAVELSLLSQNVSSPASQAPQSTSWNKSVHSGLRTSFGSKAQGKMKAAAPDFADLVDEVESPRPVEFENGAPDVDDVNMDLQQDHLTMAETSDPSSEGVEGDLPSAPSPEHEETKDVSYPASDGEVEDDAGSDIDKQLGMTPSDGALDEMLDEDEDESLSAINHGSAVNDSGLNRENENVTKGGAKHAYPTNVRPGKHVYRSGSQTYHLSELRKEGQQISLKDINFEDFVHHFVITNPENYQLLKPKNFKGAYNTYLNAYYKGTKSKVIGKLDAQSEQFVEAAIQDMKTLPTITPPTILDPEYPRDISKLKDSARFYNRQHNTEFELIEVLKDEKQIRLHDITFQDFAPHFMRTNPRIYHLLSPRMVVAAFKAYLNLYYGNQSAETRERILGAASQGRDKFVEKTLQDTQSILLTSEPDENANQPSTVPLATEMASANREMAGVAPGNPKFIEVGSSCVPNAQQVAPSKSSNAAPISFTPINTPRRSIPTQSDAISSTSRDIPSATQSGHDVGNDGVVTRAESFSNLSESRASSEESDVDMDVDIDKVEMDLQLKYFPAVDGEVVGPRCLACADIGHKTLECPALLCSFCGDDGNHSDFTCPKNQRCGKCRQKGHSKEYCPEKLLARNAEAGECDLCKSSEHLEVNCHYIWRSFVTKSEEVRTVSGIPIHCYSCGSTGHYGPECGLHQGIILSGGITWSKSNLQKYLDRDSKDRAICSGVNYSIPKNPGKVFNIKGKANDPITLDDSDDEVSFLHSRVEKDVAKPHQGQIRFGHNPRPAVNLSGNTSNNRNPQRHAALAPAFGPPRRQQDSARYGRERSFSPPPAYDNYDQAFPQDDRYHSQAPVLSYRQNNYRPPAGNMQGPSQTYTFQPARDQPGGGNRGRTRNSRGGGGRGGGAAHPPPKEPKKENKKTKQKAAKTVRGGKAAR